MSNAPSLLATATAVISSTKESDTASIDVQTESAENESDFDLIDLLPPMEHAASTDMQKPIATLKHTRVRNFTVGQFTFVDYRLNLYTKEEAIAFQKAFIGLDNIDRIAIVTLNLDAIAASEKSYSESSTYRGPIASRNIKDPKLVS